MIGDILQPTHLLLILVVALLVLGPKRLPEVGRSLGRGLRDFRMALSTDDHDELPSHSPPPEAAQPVTTQSVQPDAHAAPEPVPAHAPAAPESAPAEHEP